MKARLQHSMCLCVRASKRRNRLACIMGRVATILCMSLDVGIGGESCKRFNGRQPSGSPAPCSSTFVITWYVSAKLLVKNEEKAPNRWFIAWPRCRKPILYPSVKGAFAVCINKCCNVFCTFVAPRLLASPMRLVRDVFCNTACCILCWKSSISLDVVLANTRMSSLNVALCFSKKPLVLRKTCSFLVQAYY